MAPNHVSISYHITLYYNDLAPKINDTKLCHHYFRLGQTRLEVLSRHVRCSWLRLASLTLLVQKYINIGNYVLQNILGLSIAFLRGKEWNITHFSSSSNLRPQLLVYIKNSFWWIFCVIFDCSSMTYHSLRNKQP